MPGCKRKSDEDTWILLQTKKERCNPKSQSVYDSTLAKLRVGTRKYFSPELIAGPNSNQNEALTTHIQSQNRPSTTSPPLVENNTQQQVKICSDCRIINDRRKIFVDKCNFCDKIACHLNRCRICGEDFCFNCYIRRYDDPTNDTYICISCLQ